ISRSVDGHGSASGSPRGRARAVLAAKGIALLFFLVLLARVLAGADWAGALSRLRAIGPAALLILVPFPVGLAFDAAAGKLLFSRLDQRVSFMRLFRVRVATEAVTTALPAGGFAAEAIGPFLLAPDPSVATSFTSSTTKRWLIIRTHGYYVAFAAATGL